MTDETSFPLVAPLRLFVRPFSLPSSIKVRGIYPIGPITAMQQRDSRMPYGWSVGRSVGRWFNL